MSSSTVPFLSIPPLASRAFRAGSNAAYLEGDKSQIPADGLIIVPTKKINKDNVDAFEAELKARIGG